MSYEDGGQIFHGLGSKGLKRIEWYAGVFAAAMLSTPSQIPGTDDERAALAQKAFDIAESMLLERLRRIPTSDTD